jgi:hypothetical protein
LGGFAGNFENGTATNCYSSGTVSGSSFYNGLFAGRKTGNPVNAVTSYCLLQTGFTINGYVSPTATGIDALGLSDVSMKDQSKFVGFDFGSVWQMNAGINNGYPSLQGMNYTQPALVRRRMKKKTVVY